MQIADIVKRIVRKLTPHKWLANHILDNFKVTFKKRKTVADHCLNHTNWAKRFNREQPFTCICGNCKNGIPVQVAGDSWYEIFRVSTKTTPIPSTSNLRYELKNGIMKFIQASNIPAPGKEWWSSQNLEQCIRDDKDEHITHAPSWQHVAETKPKLKDWVIAPKDKNIGDTFIQCPRAFWTQLNNLFPLNDGHYKKATIAKEVFEARCDKLCVTIWLTAAVGTALAKVGHQTRLGYATSMARLSGCFGSRERPRMSCNELTRERTALLTATLHAVH